MISMIIKLDRFKIHSRSLMSNVKRESHSSHFQSKIISRDKLEPYITPRKLLGNIMLPIKCKLAFICYCPMPVFFDKYRQDITLTGRYFIHTHNSHIMLCNYSGLEFIVIAEVYGGPVSVTTVEELKYYGIDIIIGIGFVGSLTTELSTGTIIVADQALIENGTTPHYVNLEDNDLYTKPTLQLGIDDISDEYVWTTNALYREYKEDIKHAIDLGCSVVNMDTSHLYAACKMLAIKCEYYAVVSDETVETDNGVWDNDLIDAANNNNNNTSHVIEAQSKMIYLILSKVANVINS